MSGQTWFRSCRPDSSRFPTRSWFFRDPVHWHAIRTWAASRKVADDSDTPTRVWSVACSRGQEAYSAALVLGSVSPHRLVQVVGSDINPALLKHARTAEYSFAHVRSVPAADRDRWFLESGHPHRIRWTPRVPENAQVTFLEHSIFNGAPPALQGGQDIVIVKNLVSYFRPELATSAMNVAVSGLAPGGLLLTGPLDVRSLKQLPHGLKPLVPGWVYQLLISSSR